MTFVMYGKHCLVLSVLRMWQCAVCVGAAFNFVRPKIVVCLNIVRYLCMNFTQTLRMRTCYSVTIKSLFW